MNPVREGVKLPDVFAGLIQPKRIGFTPSEVAENRKEWIKEWRTSAAK
jgi:thiamine transport system substrate-binding protein